MFKLLHLCCIRGAMERVYMCSMGGMCTRAFTISVTALQTYDRCGSRCEVRGFARTRRTLKRCIGRLLPAVHLVRSENRKKRRNEPEASGPDGFKRISQQTAPWVLWAPHRPQVTDSTYIKPPPIQGPLIKLAGRGRVSVPAS